MRHVKSKHPLNGKCPICGNEGKRVVRHFLLMADECERHLVFYGVYVTRKATRNKAYIDRACELLWVEE